MHNVGLAAVFYPQNPTHIYEMFCRALHKWNSLCLEEDLWTYQLGRELTSQK